MCRARIAGRIRSDTTTLFRFANGVRCLGFAFLFVQSLHAQLTLHTVTPNSVMPGTAFSRVVACCSGLSQSSLPYGVKMEFYLASGPWVADGTPGFDFRDLSPGYQQFAVSVPQPVLALPSGTSLTVRVVTYIPTYIISNSKPFQVLSGYPGPQICAFQPSIITASQTPISLLVFGSNFHPGDQLYLNLTYFPTTYINSGWIQTIVPSNHPMLMKPGGITATVASLAWPFISNTMVIPVLTPASNLGQIGFYTPGPIPGALLTLNIESVASSSHFILVASSPPATPVFPWPNASMPMIFGIDLPTMFTVFDFLEVANNSYLHPMSVGPGYRFSVPITPPNPPNGLDYALQAAWIDPASPVGYRLTYPISPLAF